MIRRISATLGVCALMIFAGPALAQNFPLLPGAQNPLAALGAQDEFAPRATQPESAPLEPVEQPAFTGPTGKVPIGTVASGVLNMMSISDYPGPWRGALSHPILSIDKNDVLFPAGSVVVGSTVLIKGPNEVIHNRLGFVPRHIVRPDGQAFEIVNQAVLDQAGVSGLQDIVDYHVGIQAAALGVFTAVETLPELLNELARDDTTVDTLINSATDRGTPILQKYITLVPTIQIRPGSHFKVFFMNELTVPVWRTRRGFDYTTVNLD
ncbi:TrbI/VirB10 family protein [Pelagibius sp. Alg239-R121]|uniref:TrbI/VirB10 family protein n=1 Tax=Pelagibius sp. Alg239-R121 TaxID=2993448 RepID=UPI0024A6C90B|nr:TrbI/VirB10 family protein [Pelagibius sp. Alg239-R121]